jgi:hypothetical protein
MHPNALRGQLLLEVQEERERQIRKEGFTLAKDDKHTRGELAQAAASYVLPRSDGAGHYRVMGAGSEIPRRVLWPSSFTPRADYYKGRRRELIIAAALIIAELERLHRAGDSACAAAAEEMDGAGNGS